MISKSEQSDSVSTIFELLATDFATHILEIEYDHADAPTLDIIKRDKFDETQAKLIYEYFLRDRLLKDISAEIREVDNKIATLGINHKTYKTSLDGNTIELKISYQFNDAKSNPFLLFKDKSIQQPKNPKIYEAHKIENGIEVTARFEGMRKS